MPTHPCTASAQRPCPEPAHPYPHRYTRRSPTETVLYQVLQEHLESWLAARREAELDFNVAPVPDYVENDFRKFLTCSIYAYGFARVFCRTFKNEFLVPFSCRARAA